MVDSAALLLNWFRAKARFHSYRRGIQQQSKTDPQKILRLSQAVWKKGHTALMTTAALGRLPPDAAVLISFRC
jgi:hypothetical protein